MIMYRETNFHGIVARSYPNQPHLSKVSEADRAEEALRHHSRFEVLRELHRVRDFRLVLCAEVCDPVGDYSVRMLREAVVDEKAKGGFEGFRSEPVVLHHPRRYIL